MKLAELLNHEHLQLPKSWMDEGFNSYYSSVSRIGLGFINLLKELDESELEGEDQFLGHFNKDSLIEGTQKVFQAVCNTIKIYLNKGNPHEAFEHFRDCFFRQEGIDHSLQPNFFIQVWPLYPRQYRLRKANDVKRHLLNSFRYSIPGHPALYMANSIFTAFRELGSPDYKDLFVSKLEFTEFYHHSVYLLDMMNRPQSSSPANIYRYLARWPLIMACNLKVEYPDSPFKAEYILPQMVFQWAKNKYKIRGERIAGVCYNSTKIESFKDGYSGSFYNTAIPVHHSNAKGHCDVLSKMFKLTEPLLFTDALNSDLVPRQIGQVKSIVLDGSSHEYFTTDFGRIESVINDPTYSELFDVNMKNPHNN